METSIIIRGTNTRGEKTQQTFTDINPQASNAEIKAFAQAINAATNNTYGETERINKISVDTEDEGKQFRNITVTGLAPNETATVTFNITEGEEYAPVVFFWTSSGTTYIQATADTSEDPTLAKYTFTAPNSTGVAYVAATANDNFYSEFVRVNCQ